MAELHGAPIAGGWKYISLVTFASSSFPPRSKTIWVTLVVKYGWSKREEEGHPEEMSPADDMLWEEGLDDSNK